MRGTTGHRGRRLAGAVLALLLAATVAACGDDECNHVLSDVETFAECQEIAVERQCSDEVTYSTTHKRCKVENCGDCDGAVPTPTALPEG